MGSFSELVASISWSTAIHDPALNFRLVREFCGCFSEGDNSELSCHSSTSPNTQDMVSHRHKTFLSSRLFSLLLLKSKVMVLIAMVLRSHFSQFLLFSESFDIISDFRWCCQISWRIEKNSSGSRWACWRSKNVSKNTHILSCISQHSNFAAKLSWTRGNRSLMRNVHNCSASQDRRRIDSLFVIPDHAV